MGRVVRGNCELICFLKDCLCAQAPEEPEQVKCCTCGELKLVSDMKMVQSEDIINGWKNQARCRDCTNLRPRLARLIKPGSEVVRGYEELTAKGRTFVPSIHVAYMLTLCCKRFKIQIRSAQNVGKVWISGKILVAPFGSFQVKFPMDWKDANMVEFIYLFEGPRRCQVEINHTTLNSFPIPKCGRQCSDSQMGEGVGRSPC